MATTEEYNTCDKCKKTYSTYELIWIDAEDFEYHEGELLRPEAFDKYIALCETCYKTELLLKGGEINI